MKIYKKKFVKLFSKLVNLQRPEILIWCDPANFEKNMDSMCAMPDFNEERTYDTNAEQTDCCSRQSVKRKKICAIQCACG